jgi:hypothetical protein
MTSVLSLVLPIVQIDAASIPWRVAREDNYGMVVAFSRVGSCWNLTNDSKFIVVA